MSLTHKIVRSVNDGTLLIAETTLVTAGAEITIDEAVPANQTNLLFALAFAVAKLQSIYIVSDVAMTLKTNSSGSPQETITLVAGTPLVWVRGDGYFTVPFAGNVTALYVTNTTAGQLQIRGIVDPT